MELSPFQGKYAGLRWGSWWGGGTGAQSFYVSVQQTLQIPVHDPHPPQTGSGCLTAGRALLALCVAAPGCRL